MILIRSISQQRLLIISNTLGVWELNTAKLLSIVLAVMVVVLLIIYVPLVITVWKLTSDENLQTPKYRYMSDYMWGMLRDSITTGLCLPKAGNGIGETSLFSVEDVEADSGLLGTPLSRDLISQLTGRQFSYTLAGNKIHLEPKSEMKTRMGSPDLVDALALTYAIPVRAKAFRGNNSIGTFSQSEYDPYSDEYMEK